jgi:hypothetical protein
MKTSYDFLLWLQLLVVLHKRIYDKENTKVKEDHEKLDELYEGIFRSKQEELDQTLQFFLPRFQDLGENFTTNNLKMLFASNLCHHVSLSIHESGHAVSGYYCADYMNPLGVTIQPSMLVSMSGRSAEESILGNKNISLSGASHDIQNATQTATSLVTRWGASDFLPPMKVYYGSTKLAFPCSFVWYTFLLC